MADLSAKLVSNIGIISGGANNDTLQIENGVYTYSLNNKGLTLSSNKFTQLRLDDFESVVVGTKHFDVADLGAEGSLMG